MQLLKLRSLFKMIYKNTHLDFLLLMKIPRQTKNAYDPDLASFKTLVSSCARSKTLLKRPVKSKKRYDTDFGSLEFLKTQRDRKSLRSRLWLVQYMKRLELRYTDKNVVRSVGSWWFLSVSLVLLVRSVGFCHFCRNNWYCCEKRRINRNCLFQLRKRRFM